jgi:hypothetical protein
MNVLSIVIILYTIYFIYDTCYCNKNNHIIENFSGLEAKELIKEFFKTIYAPNYIKYLDFMEKKGIKPPHTLLMLNVYKQVEVDYKVSKLESHL